MSASYAVVEGIPQPGAFPRALTHPNIEDAALAPWGIPIPSALRTLRIKRWWHVAIVHPEVYLGFAIIQAGYAANAFVVAAPAAGGTPWLQHRERLSTKAVQVAHPVPGGRSFARGKVGQWQIHHAAEEGDHLVRVSVEATETQPALDFQGSLHGGKGVQDLAQLLADDEGHLLYTRKAPWPVSGTLRVAGRSYTLDPERDIALVDEHHATYPYRFFWYWATGAGTLTDGRRVALNLCQNPFSVDNQRNENGFWLDGVLHRLPAIQAGLKPEDPMKPWTFADPDDKVSVRFVPHSTFLHLERLVVLESRLLQVRGELEGHVTLEDGRKVHFAEIPGLCENHQARL